MDLENQVRKAYRDLVMQLIDAVYWTRVDSEVTNQENEWFSLDDWGSDLWGMLVMWGSDLYGDLNYVGV